MSQNHFDLTAITNITLTVLIDPSETESFNIRQHLVEEGINIGEDVEIYYDIDTIVMRSHYMNVAGDEENKDVLTIARRPNTGTGTIPLILPLTFSQPVHIPLE